MRHVDNGVFRSGNGGLGNLSYFDRLGPHPLGCFHRLCWMGLVVRHVDWAMLLSLQGHHGAVGEIYGATLDESAIVERRDGSGKEEVVR